MGKNKVIKEIISWVLILCGAFLAATIINSQVFEKVIVQQSSMDTTLFDGQHLIVNKLSYNFNEPKSGDIIIFQKYEKMGTLINDIKNSVVNLASLFDKEKKREKNDYLVKRVIGVEGDEVDIIDGSVYINGVNLEEPYAKGVTEKKVIELPIIVGKDEVFVLGDNREVSTDSRAFGPIKINQVAGKVIFRLYPFDKMGKIK
ncbi:MAG: signal peptidase I [Mobilitalea sp.]